MKCIAEEQVVLRKIDFDLDSTLGTLACSVSTLTDVQIEFNQLVDSMERVVESGEEKDYYQEHFRKIRVLTTLFHYAMNDLSRTSEEADIIQRGLHAFVNESPHKLSNRFDSRAVLLGN